MRMQFPTNQVGNFQKSTPKAQRHSGNWGNGANPFDRLHWFNSHEWISKKEFTPAFTSGDRLHANPYYRHAAVVREDVPTVFVREGWDHNGQWYERWEEPISVFIPFFVHGPIAEVEAIAANLRSKCITEALNKLRQGKVQNGADIAQAATTATMISKQAYQLFSAVKALKSGNLSQFLSILGLTKRGLATAKTPAEQWLAYQYGWKPLLGSIHDNVELLKTQLRSEGACFSVKRRASQVFRKKYFGQHNDDVVVEIRVEVGLTARLDNGFVDVLDTFGLINPLEVVWEVVPFSFVLDWFMPIGNVLESLSATAGLDFVTGYCSSSQHHKWTTVRSTNSLNGWTLQNPGRLVRESLSFNREKFIDFPAPEFYADHTPFSQTRLSNAAALLRQLLMR